MKKSFHLAIVGAACLALGSAAVLSAQDAPPRDRQDRPQDRGQMPPGDRQFDRGPGGFGPGGFGPGGFGGPGPMREERKLVKQFDTNKDGWLNNEERKAARQLLKDQPTGRGGRGFGPRGRGENAQPPQPGQKVSPADVKSYPDAKLYEPMVLRTLFIDFENADWEAELAEFHGTDVEVPATLTVDGKKYPNVGIHFRGMSSYMMVPAGQKRSLNLAIDLVDKKQRLLGYKTLNLLNSHEDPTFLHTVLYSHVARNYIPTPKANLVKVVINGENWGVYVNAQQFNNEFIQESFSTTKGARWKASGSPRTDGGLTYVGEDVEQYQRRYEVKSGDNKKSWQALINLCRILNSTPPDKLEEALKPILDIDGALWFLALDDALANGDGYWVRNSDYNIYLDPKGMFHIIPHDVNETFSAGGGPGGPGGPGGFSGRGARGGFGGFRDGGPRPEGARAPEGQPAPAPGGQAAPGPVAGGPPGPGGPVFGGGRGVELDPLVALNDASKPLRSKLLAVPALRARYLQHVRTIAQQWLDWNKLQPFVAQQRALIEKEVEADTRKLESYEAFKAALAETSAPQAQPAGRRPTMPLKSFVEQRRNFLLNHPEIKKLDAQ